MDSLSLKSYHYKPIVEAARDVHTRDSSCRGHAWLKLSRTDTQMDRWMDRHCATIRASRANSQTKPRASTLSYPRP